MRSISASGTARLPTFLALAFHEHRPGWVEPPQLVPDQGVEALLRGLRLAGDHAQHGAAMAGQRFEVQHLGAGLRQRLQQPRLAGTGGPADHAIFEPCRQLGQGGQHRGAEGLVAAFEDADPEADLAQHQGQRAAALSAAPAVGQRLPGARACRSLRARCAARYWRATSAAPRFCASNGLTCA